MAVGALPLVTGSLPLVPSPAVTGLGNDDFLTGLIDAAPAAIQGLQAGQQMRDERDKRSANLLQTYAPIALQDPTNKKAIQAVQKSIKALGGDPNMVMKSDGTLNTDALSQYSPWFQLVSSSGFAFFPAGLKKAILQQAFGKNSSIANSPMSDNSFLDPKTANTLETQAYKALSTGQWDVAGGLAQQLMNSGDDRLVGIGQQLYNAANGKVLPPNLASEIGRRDLLNTQTEANIAYTNGRAQLVKAQTSEVGAQASYYTSLTTLNGARVALTGAQTKEATARIGQIQADTQKAIADTQKAYADIGNDTKRLNLEFQKLSSSNLNSALTAATDYNRSFASLQQNYSSLQRTVQQYEQNGLQFVQATDPQTGAPVPGSKVPNPDYVAAQQQMKTVAGQLKNMKGPIDLTKVSQAALQRSGLPSTFTVNSFEPGGDNGNTKNPLAPKNNSNPSVIPEAQLKVGQKYKNQKDGKMYFYRGVDPRTKQTLWQPAS